MAQNILSWGSVAAADTLITKPVLLHTVTQHHSPTNDLWGNEVESADSSESHQHSYSDNSWLTLKQPARPTCEFNSAWQSCLKTTEEFQRRLIVMSVFMRSPFAASDNSADLEIRVAPTCWGNLVLRWGWGNWRGTVCIRGCFLQKHKTTSAHVPLGSAISFFGQHKLLRKV